MVGRSRAWSGSSRSWPTMRRTPTPPTPTSCTTGSQRPPAARSARAGGTRSSTGKAGNATTGPADAHARINLAQMSAEDLFWLPRMTEDLVARILDWTDPDDEANPAGRRAGIVPVPAPAIRATQRPDADHRRAGAGAGRLAHGRARRGLEPQQRPGPRRERRGAEPARRRRRRPARGRLVRAADHQQQREHAGAFGPAEGPPGPGAFGPGPGLARGDLRRAGRGHRAVRRHERGVAGSVGDHASGLAAGADRPADQPPRAALDRRAESACCWKRPPSMARGCWKTARRSRGGST
ncbi:MAG: hypothetical protein KatS3mg103_0898 [Phycisphaerales bacterium]|nr:MAG: hypothetical protein KatS3mg103_0898 [Phycisphaerales bacterium]